MADPRDDRVSGAYRELPGDGPTPALDAAIQAAARRAVGSRPGTARRWQIPVSIAAVLALAIGVSLQVDREKPMVADGTPFSSGSAEYPVPQAEPEKEERAAPAKQVAAPAAAIPQSAAPAPAPLAKEAPPQAAKVQPPAPEAKRFAPEPARSEPPAAVVPATPAAPAPAPAAARAPMQSPAMNVAPAPATPPAAAGAVAPAEAIRAAPQPALRAKSELARDATTQEKAMSQAMETPERRLERIADLRAKGLHEEADRALAEFRRAYPGYRIDEEWLRKVERR